MFQVHYFDTMPQTIVNGGYKKGKWVVWLNIARCPNLSSVGLPGQGPFQAQTERLVLTDNSLEGFLSVVNPLHLAIANNEDVAAILDYFQCTDDIESWKRIRAAQIQGYDSSQYVNSFYLGPTPMWLDKATRVGLVNSLNAEKAAGRTHTALWAGTTKIELPIDVGLNLLNELELYALDCFGVTASHLSAIETSQSIEELRAFDITADYPAPPKFEL